MSDKKDLEKKDDSKAADPELDELLDSALQDLTTKKKEDDPVADTIDTDAGEGQWSNEFVQQAAAQFETTMASLLGRIQGTNPTVNDIEQNLQRMAEAAASTVNNPQVTEQSNDFASTITRTLQHLSVGAENLQNPFSDIDYAQMFGGLGGADAGEAAGFLPFMQGMMQSLLSKEVLYPSLKEISGKYPDWLEKNKDKLEAAEIERYNKQRELMEKVCQELEGEKEDDAELVKQQRFEKILSLMQKMQDLGQPPQELVGDMGPGLQFDNTGNPVFPSGMNADQCTLM